MKPHPELPKAFADLGIELSFLKALQKMGFHTPTPVQTEMIPLVLAGRDVLGQARTGTGKTLAFALPILQIVDDSKHVQAVILEPTRELAVQVAAEVRRLAQCSPLNVVPVYGGQAVKHQVKLLGRSTQVVVATPGRLLDLLNRRIIDFSHVKHAVLDEVDRMLDIGFIDDIRRILSRVPTPNQTVFVSATLTSDIKSLARQFMSNTADVNVSRDELTVDSVEQVYCSVDPWDKVHLLKIILREEKPKLAIVFTNTKHTARRLAKRLHEMGFSVKEIHGDLVQRKRERVMERFRRHQIDVLVATDLAARGIDVSSISHIINFDIPPDPQVYVHRIGRTARMGEFGRAISLTTREEGKQLTQIEVLINKEIPEIKYDGFQPRPPREEEKKHEPRPVSRFDAPAFGSGIAGKAAPATAPPKTLGSKFRTRRRR